MKNIILFFFFLLYLLHGNAALADKKITVAVAANVQYVMEQLKKNFEAETNIKVELIPGSSGKLTAQILEGAPYDVFVSADMAYPQDLYHKGITVDKPEPYAIGQLVLWTANANLKLTTNLKILLSDAVKKIAVANPKNAPYGIAAIQTLNYYKMYDNVKDKLVYGESIAQTQQFIASEAAEIGFIAKSYVLTEALIGKGQWIAIDNKAYQPIIQGAVILKHGRETNLENAQLFWHFLFSEKAKTVFKKYGY